MGPILYKLKCGLQLAEDEDWLIPSELLDGDSRWYNALLRKCIFDRCRTRWGDRDATFVLYQPDFRFGLSAGIFH